MVSTWLPQMSELPEQNAFGLGVEFPHLGITQVVEAERAVLRAVGRRDFRIEPGGRLVDSASH